MRLFVSVDLDGLAGAVEAVQEPLRGLPGLSLTAPENAHVTITFLGEVERERVPVVEGELAAAVEAAEVAPFEATFGGLGVFPALEYIRVVYLGVESGAEGLRTLHETVERRLVAAGVEPADHDFTPHVTLARMEHAGGKEQVQTVVEERHPTAGGVQVEELRLTESSPAEGPRYETVMRVPL
jgi:2'-5' RNA ligase